jgi:hypothetical protein
MTNSSVRVNEHQDAAANFETWNEQKFAEYLTKSGLGQYSEMFMHHKISGRLAPLLTDTDLKDMGIKIVG